MFEAGTTTLTVFFHSVNFKLQGHHFGTLKKQTLSLHNENNESMNEIRSEGVSACSSRLAESGGGACLPAPNH